jgi:hypothetical protein
MIGLDWGGVGLTTHYNFHQHLLKEASELAGNRSV